MIRELNFSPRRKLPVIHQTESMECGLACIAMVANYHGHQVDLNGLRQLFPVSQKGTTLEGLINISARLAIGARAVKLELDSLHNLQMPAILHWNLNHYVVLKKVTNQKVYIHDPLMGARTLDIKDVSKAFTGIALEVMPVSNFKPQKIQKRVKISDLWSKLIGLKKSLVQLVFLSFILQLAALLMPFYLQIVVDRVLVELDRNLLFFLAIGFFGVIIIQSLTRLMREWAVLYYSNQMSFQLVANIFTHLMHLPSDYFEKRRIGDILSRLKSTVPIRDALTQGLVTFVLDAFMAVMTGIVIVIYSPSLSVIVLISGASLLLLTLSFFPILNNAQERVISVEADEESFKIESIRASTPIKMFARENVRIAKWRNYYANYINANVAFGKITALKKSLHNIIVGLQGVLIVYFAAGLIIEKDSIFTIGMLFAFIAYQQSFTTSIANLFEKYLEFKLLRLHLVRIADILHTEAEHVANVQPEYDITGNVELRNVSFRYSESDPWVIDHVNLEINSNEFIVLTGPSGGGKTTLLKLILGLYQPTDGELLIDGHPLNKKNQLHWRKNIGIVMQDDQLLSGTLAENISFFDGDIDMSRVYKAAKLAQIHKTIKNMPMGYQSFIGEMGSALSGGQKQRILLARALYNNPKVLLLDEGTANLDQETEKIIVETIKNLQITRIIVAHRTEFLKKADRVIIIGENQ